VNIGDERTRRESGREKEEC
jgi:hypothetical protein